MGAINGILMGVYAVVIISVSSRYLSIGPHNICFLGGMRLKAI